ncbi:DUF317 domain-containing protein [Streptomyces sp. SID8366]|uniref:DUF317 domain-containing protein n=1 Tax=unclassified Streptomyces TaxID=2593676 RepID=UPI000DBA5A1F|nr:DUF317 domain-containing protein [Streptomyces sp. PsTaAH-130]MYU06113.1 DUF317 domain-containing protein [Streptomyces sp. SID8366]MYU61686.1 DUF317 domain-containing protein [Streptomyces sp. SID69]RAJ64184.1 uncharacterized protein DUF317 [Streptomyces sp. PsTaAH-130]
MNPQPDPLHEIDGEVHVFPRYLAGLPGHAYPSFDPVAHWPHHHLDGPFQHVVTSPDHRIRIGWAGDNYDTWVISAASDPISMPRWTARINQNTPPEIVEGLTRALAQDWTEDSDTFLTSPSPFWNSGVQPLLDAGWESHPVKAGVLEIVAPDGLAGASIDVVEVDPAAETVTLWAGPPGWGTRAEAIFTARTPKHLIAATAAALADPTPVLREKHSLHPKLAELAQLTPLPRPRPAGPTPRDLRRAAAARRPTTAPVRSVPRWTTSTPTPPAHAGPRPGLRR